MKQETGAGSARKASSVGGLAGWVLKRLHAAGVRSVEPHLAVVERIALGPRHSLALVEAEGRRFLVATSAEGTPAFYPLERVVGVGGVGGAGIHGWPGALRRTLPGAGAKASGARISW